MENQVQDFWRKCSACKKSIGFNTPYFVCSVSTCNGQRTGYVFCSLGCFETHLPGARHREAGAIEKVSPKTLEASPGSTPPSTPSRIIVKTAQSNTSSSGAGGHKALPREVLIVASRLKEYIQARSDYNTSGSVMEVLSDHVRIIADRAIDNARSEGRKTVLDRDLEFLKEVWKRF
jgi:hypothetical protein